jgi:hypothetical protein
VCVCLSMCACVRVFAILACMFCNDVLTRPRMPSHLHVPMIRAPLTLSTDHICVHKICRVVKCTLAELRVRLGVPRWIAGNQSFISPRESISKFDIDPPRPSLFQQVCSHCPKNDFGHGSSRSRLPYALKCVSV